MFSVLHKPGLVNAAAGIHATAKDAAAAQTKGAAPRPLPVPSDSGQLWRRLPFKGKRRRDHLDVVVWVIVGKPSHVATRVAAAAGGAPAKRVGEIADVRLDTIDLPIVDGTALPGITELREDLAVPAEPADDVLIEGVLRDRLEALEGALHIGILAAGAGRRARSGAGAKIQRLRVDRQRGRVTQVQIELVRDQRVVHRDDEGVHLVLDVGGVIVGRSEGWRASTG